MTPRRLSRERPDAATARSGLADGALALWLVAAFLGGLVGAHYLLARVVFLGATLPFAAPPL
jgi:hypothetical protein